MATVGVRVATSDSIFFEIDGRQIAGVESYATRYSNDAKTIDAFGQNAPIGFANGSKKYSIDISKVYLEDTAIDDGIDFYNLSDYNWSMVVIKPHKDGKQKRTKFTNCVITEISEDGALKDRVAEKITIMALDRVVEII